MAEQETEFIFKTEDVAKSLLVEDQTANWVVPEFVFRDGQMYLSASDSHLEGAIRKLSLDFHRAQYASSEPRLSPDEARQQALRDLPLPLLLVLAAAQDPFLDKIGTTDEELRLALRGGAIKKRNRMELALVAKEATVDGRGVNRLLSAEALPTFLTASELNTGIETLQRFEMKLKAKTSMDKSPARKR